jgi:hypothetical protein
MLQDEIIKEYQVVHQLCFSIFSETTDLLAYHTKGRATKINQIKDPNLERTHTHTQKPH